MPLSVSMLYLLVYKSNPIAMVYPCVPAVFILIRRQQYCGRIWWYNKRRSFTALLSVLLPAAFMQRFVMASGNIDYSFPLADSMMICLLCFLIFVFFIFLSERYADSWFVFHGWYPHFILAGYFEYHLLFICIEIYSWNLENISGNIFVHCCP